MKRQLFTIIVASTISLNSSIAAGADSDGYITQLFPPLTEVIYKAGTPNTLNSRADSSMIPSVRQGETLRIQFVVPPGATTAGVGGTSNYWNTGATFGFFNCNPGNASTAQSQMTRVSGGLSLKAQRPSNIPINEPFFTYFLVHNPPTSGSDFSFISFTQNISINDGAAYSSWVNKGRCLPTADYACSFVSGSITTPNKGTSSCTSSTSTPTTTTPPSSSTNYFLFVNNANTSSGMINSSDGKINCGSGLGCSTQYPAGTSITLTATPSAGFHFSGWSGISGCSTNLQCTFSMDKDKSVNAAFVSDITPVVEDPIGAVTTGTSECNGCSVITSIPSLDSSYKAGSSVTTTFSTDVLTPQLGKILNLWVWLENVADPNMKYYLDNSGNLTAQSKKIFAESVQFLTTLPQTLQHNVSFSIPFNLLGNYTLKAVYVPVSESVDSSEKWQSKLFKSPMTITKGSLPQLTINGLKPFYRKGETVNITLSQEGERFETVDLWVAIKGAMENDPFQILNSDGTFTQGSFNAQGLFESADGSPITAYKQGISANDSSVDVTFTAPISEFTIYAAYAKIGENLLENLDYRRSEIAVSEKTNFRAEFAFDVETSYTLNEIADIVFKETQSENRAEKMDLWVSVKTPNNVVSFIGQGDKLDQIVSETSTTPEPFRAKVPAHSRKFHFHLKGETEGVYTVCATFFKIGEDITLDFLNNAENSSCEQINFVKSTVTTPVVDNTDTPAVVEPPVVVENTAPTIGGDLAIEVAPTTTTYTALATDDLNTTDKESTSTQLTYTIKSVNNVTIKKEVTGTTVPLTVNAGGNFTQSLIDSGKIKVLLTDKTLNGNFTFIVKDSAGKLAVNPVDSTNTFTFTITSLSR